VGNQQALKELTDITFFTKLNTFFILNVEFSASAPYPLLHTLTQPKPEAAAVSPTCGQRTARSFTKTGTTISVVILIMNVMLRAIGNDLQGIAQCC